MRVALIAAAGLLTAAAYYYATRRDQAEADTGSDWASAAADTLDTFTETIMSTFRLSSMGSVTAADVAHPNVRAFLRVIRRGEGTSDEAGYRRMFGGKLFESFHDHPRVKNTYTLRSGQTITSTAAGAYQFLSSTWDETRRAMRLPDFTPQSQDWAAVGRLAARGALEDVKAGRFEAAITKTAREWASLPGSPYGQPVISMTTAQNVYTTNGGTYA